MEIIERPTTPRCSLLRNILPTDEQMPAQKLSKFVRTRRSGNAMRIFPVEVESAADGENIARGLQQAGGGDGVLKNLTFRKADMLEEFSAIHLIPSIGMEIAAMFCPVGGDIGMSLFGKCEQVLGCISVGNEDRKLYDVVFGMPAEGESYLFEGVALERVVRVDKGDQFALCMC